MISESRLDLKECVFVILQLLYLLFQLFVSLPGKEEARDRVRFLCLLLFQELIKHSVNYICRFYLLLDDEFYFLSFFLQVLREATYLGRLLLVFLAKLAVCGFLLFASALRPSMGARSIVLCLALSSS